MATALVSTAAGQSSESHSKDVRCPRVRIRAVNSTYSAVNGVEGQAAIAPAAARLYRTHALSAPERYANPQRAELGAKSVRNFSFETELVHVLS